MEKSDEHQLLIRGMIRRAVTKVNEARETVNYWQNHCQHPNVEKTHKRVDGYCEEPEFYTNMKCVDCLKQWTEKGSL